MIEAWPMVRLGDLMRRIKDDTIVEDFTTYQRLTIHLNNKGISVRDEVFGSEIGTKRQFIVHGGQFLLSKIDARNGAFGIVPIDVENGIITGNFWAYDVDNLRLHTAYFNYLTHTPLFQDFCIRSSSGTTNRRYLQENLFLGQEMPLPRLDEQRRIVARIEALAAKIEEARGLRRLADIEAKALFQSRVNNLLEEKASSWEMATLPEFVSSNRHSVKRGPFGSHLRKEFFVESGYKIYEQKHAIYGDFKAGRYYIDENKFQELKSFEVRPGDLIISCSGTIGKVSIVPEDAKPGIINQALLKITLDTKKINGRFFKLVFESDFIKSEVESISPGSAMKNIGSVKILKKILFPLPPLEEQRRIVAYLDGLQAKVDALKQLQSQTRAEIEALLPSVLDKAFNGQL